FAMAAAVFEVLETRENPDWSLVEIEVCPGISAMQAAAAQVGAPLGHDFAVISLSDILKPWSVVESRLRAAAQGDFAIALYNPVSKQRTWQLDRARELLLEWRSPATPVVLARNLGRVGQGVRVKPLAEVTAGDADMRTVILIGSSQTRQVQSGEGRPWVYTPRTYGG
ncbi:MAG: SAM-dependent methyltransferase, partial [Cyanobacteriota bacterium]